VPEYTTAEWYRTRERAPHLEQAGHRDRLFKTAELAQQLLPPGGNHSVVDLGCGDGGLLSLLKAEKKRGYDLSPEAVKAACELRGVPAQLLDVVNEEPQWGYLTIATEMLEHLVDPHAMVRRIYNSSQAVVASSPWNECPPQQHYEFHTWAWDKPGYRSMFEAAGWRVVAHEVVQTFQILSAVKRP
jgi:2-polyprenyl-3-methyl-5-hydroxy-6-metoxy-1,4-benzoquinol methylase